MTQTPAEQAHNRILSDIHAPLTGVTYEDFLAVARRSGTEEVPSIRAALQRLRQDDRRNNLPSYVHRT